VTNSQSQRASVFEIARSVDDSNDENPAQDIILISQITARANLGPQPIVLLGTSGRLDDQPTGRHLFVQDHGSVVQNGGPVVGQLYKLRFNVAGEFETILNMQYIGFAAEFRRFIFTTR